MDCSVGGELVGDARGGRAGLTDPAHYAEAMAGKRWFGDAAGEIEAAAAADLGLLDWMGMAVSAAVQASPLNRLAANLEELGLEGMASSVPEYVRLVAEREEEPGRRHARARRRPGSPSSERRRRRARHEDGQLPLHQDAGRLRLGFQPSVPRGLVEQLATLRAHRPRRQRRARRQPGRRARPTCGSPYGHAGGDGPASRCTSPTARGWSRTFKHCLGEGGAGAAGCGSTSTAAC